MIVHPSVKGEEAELNELIVVAGPEDRPYLIGDFRSTTLYREEQKRNCALAARAPAMAEALIEIESCVGDLRACDVTQTVYDIIAKAMRGLKITPRHDPDDHA